MISKAEQKEIAQFVKDAERRKRDTLTIQQTKDFKEDSFTENKRVYLCQKAANGPIVIHQLNS